MGKEEEKECISWNCWVRTFFAASGALFLFMFTGITEAQSAVMLPELKRNDSFIQINSDQETWIGMFAVHDAVCTIITRCMTDPILLMQASLGILTTPISAIFCGPFIDVFGRKKGLQLFFFTAGVGFGVIACAQEVYHIYIGRLICAFSVGLEVCAVIYLAEVSTKRQRSILFSIGSPAFTFGVTLTYIVGYFPWNIASAIYSLGCFIFFVLQWFTPESPSWLFKMGKIEDTRQCLERLGRTPTAIQEELDSLRQSKEEGNEKVDFRTFLEPTVWKPFVLITIFHFIQCAAGLYDILYYTVDFIEKLGTSYDPLKVSILLASVRFLFNCSISTYFTSTVSRKKATAISGFMMGVCYTGIGVYEYIYRDTTVAERSVQWVPITLIIVNVVTSTWGVLCLPWIMKGEIFPLKVRGVMTGAAFVAASIFMFISIKIYDVWMDSLKIYGYVFSVAVPSFFAVYFGLFVLPETQNKTLYEIEKSFMPKKKILDSEAVKPHVETDSPTR